MKADKAYLFIYKDEKTEQFMQQYEIIEQQLKNKGIEIVKAGINLLDYIEIIQNISKVIKTERENSPDTEIHINISVGTNITAIAAMDACRFWDCSPYYVVGEHYLSQKEITAETMSLSSGQMEIFKPPIFKLIKPEAKLIKALRIIAEKKTGIYKKEFRKKLLANNLLIIHKSYDDPRDPKKLSAEYMAMNQQFIYPLKNTWKFIEISNAKRNQKITLTTIGEEIVQIFKFIV